MRAELASTFWTHSLHNASLAEELVQLLRLLGGAGVPVIPLKGVALAESLYGDPALRACADTDVLCRPAMPARLFSLSFPPDNELGIHQPASSGPGRCATANMVS